MPRVKLSFHPTFHTPDLDYSEEFFRRVFGRPSRLLEVMPKGTEPAAPAEPKGYSKFTMVSDVLIDCVCPALLRINGVQAAPAVDAPVLQNIGWYCDDIDETFLALRQAQIPIVTQLGKPVEGDTVPTPDQGGAIKMFFTAPEGSGLRYQFLSWFPMALDPRTQPGWSVPAVSDADPLGIEHLSHHVVLTGDPARALRLTVDALGGQVIDEGRDEQRQITGPYVRLTDCVYHFATPDPGTPAATALAAKSPADKFYAMTWKVADLDRVARHLEPAGVRIESRTDDTIVTDPATSFNTTWGFTTKTVHAPPA
jgi:catechol 2,3-dioxygenase-like lactoylglutathione lyase family enzyme